jgi:hypothetical protein
MFLTCKLPKPERGSTQTLVKNDSFFSDTAYFRFTSANPVVNSSPRLSKKQSACRHSHGENVLSDIGLVLSRRILSMSSRFISLRFAVIYMKPRDTLCANVGINFADKRRFARGLKPRSCCYYGSLLRTLNVLHSKLYPTYDKSRLSTPVVLTFQLICQRKEARPHFFVSVLPFSKSITIILILCSIWCTVPY